MNIYSANSAIQDAQRGDIVSVAKGPLGITRHFGVRIGWYGMLTNAVAHNQNGRGVEIVTEQEFSDGKPVRVEARARSFLEQEIIVERALRLIGQNYDLAKFNCEHFASYAQTGQPKSNQVELAGIIGGACLLFVGLAMLGGGKR